MRYVIYGAGAVGGVIGGRLHAAGRDVALLARGPHLDALRREGLRLLTPDADERHDIPSAGSPAELGVRADDVVVLTVKGQDTIAALDALAAVTTDVAVVCAQNGVENERVALRRFGRVYGMCVWLPGVHLSPGVVIQHSAPVAGSLDIGRYPHGTDDLATRVADDLTAAGFSSRPDPAIMRAKYRKLLSNLGNALDAVTVESFGTELFHRAQAEAEACFAAAGIDVQPAEEAQRQHVTIRDVPGHPWAGSSSRQSLARGTGSIETDHLNGEIVLLGRLHGVATPVNEALQRLATRAAREGWEPGRLTAAEVEAELR